MTPEIKKERYLIVFNFGSFVYMFFVIGLSIGVLFAALEMAITLVKFPSFSSIGFGLLGFVTMPFGAGLLTAVLGMIGFLPYRWLCKRGWGWPIKGVFIKIEEPEEREL